jgi:Rrf2 family nitric oxide-sensitive transcriptional repressor
MFTKSVEYAVNLLSAMPKVGEVASAKTLSKAGKVPSAYASKVLQHLRNAGIVSSQRGVGGGVTLLRPLNKISLTEIIDAVVGGEAPKKGTAAAKKGEELRKFLSKMMVK